jgi:hypothetical protein
MGVAIEVGVCEGGNRMGRRHLAILTAALLLFVIPATAFASDDGDTDTRMVDAKVVEVTEHRISVIARTGVEHVIAINDSGTKVSMKGKAVSLKDLRKGDVVTVELDEMNPLKFARQISIAVSSDSELATAVP